MMKIYDKKLAYPYFVWMTLFTVVPLTVLVQPEEKHLSMPRPKTSRQLLAALGLAEETALVAREGQLLTPDRHIWPGDNLLVRKVASSG